MNYFQLDSTMFKIPLSIRLGFKGHKFYVKNFRTNEISLIIAHKGKQYWLKPNWYDWLISYLFRYTIDEILIEIDDEPF